MAFSTLWKANPSLTLGGLDMPRCLGRNSTLAQWNHLKNPRRRKRSRPRAVLTRRSRQRDIVHDTQANVRGALELIHQTNHQKSLATSLARLIEKGRVKVPIYTTGRVHSEGGILDYPPGQLSRLTGLDFVYEM